MANGLMTPLQITAAYGLGSNTALRIPASVIAAYTAYNGIPYIAEINNAIANATHSTWATGLTKHNIQSIAGTANECPALGNAPPLPNSLTNYYDTRYYPGFSGYINTIADLYLGVAEPSTADNSIFCQGFTAASSYCDNVNKLINSATNAQTYLGPTFPGNNALVTNSISNVNPDFGNFSKDLSAQGKLTNLADIALYGTPAGLLKQIANVAVINGDTLLVVKTQLLATGLSTTDIKNLINRPSTMSDNDFNQLQMLAYSGMTNVTGTDLQQVLSLLDITTPNINTMADLINQKKIFPNSFLTLQSPTAGGFVNVYMPDGSVNSNLTSSIVAVTGCEELGKVMPPDQAVASKSVQAGLQQITGVTGTSLSKLAAAIQTVDPTTGQPVSGLSTMAGLPLIQNQTTVLDPAVSSYYSANATGSGPNGTITVSDIIGSLWGFNVTDPLLATVAALASIPAGAFSTLTTIYTRIYNVTQGIYGDPSTGPVVVPFGPGSGYYANGNDALATLIPLANSAISTIAASYHSQCSAANSNFTAISRELVLESQYQTKAGIAYGSYTPNSQTSVNAFTQNLPRYGTMTEPYDEAYFLNQVANLGTLGGQAVVGAMREGVNNQQLNAAGLGLNIKPSADPANPPAPAVLPVY